MNKQTGLSARMDRWIHHSYPVTAPFLALCRVVYASSLLYLFLSYGRWFRFEWLAELPDVLYAPVAGPGMLSSGFPPAFFYQTLTVLVVVLSFLLLVGWRTKAVSILLSLVLMLAFSFFFVFGKVEHLALLLLLPLVMAFSNWGAAWSMDANAGRTGSEVQSWPITFMSLLIGFGFFTAGWAKLSGGWLATDSQAVLAEVILRGEGHWLADSLLQIAPDFLWEMLDVLTVLFELAFLPAILWPKRFRLFLGAAIAFHGLNFLLLGIDFSFMFIVYFPFLPDFPAARFKGAMQVRWWMLSIAAGAYFAVLYAVGSPFLLLSQALGFTGEIAPLWLLYIGVLGVGWVYAFGKMSNLRNP